MTPGERIAADWMLSPAGEQGLAADIDLAIEADRRASIRALQRERVNCAGALRFAMGIAITVLRARGRKMAKR